LSKLKKVVPEVDKQKSARCRPVTLT